MNKRFSTRRASILLVAALAAVTLAGHLLTSGTSAVPVRPPGTTMPVLPAVGTGAALRMGREGNADLLLTTRPPPRRNWLRPAS